MMCDMLFDDLTDQASEELDGWADGAAAQQRKDFDGETLHSGR